MNYYLSVYSHIALVVSSSNVYFYITFDQVYDWSEPVTRLSIREPILTCMIDQSQWPGWVSELVTIGIV